METTKKQKNKIKISIIIPTNGKRVRETSLALESIAKQKGADKCELVMVSEGSSVSNKFDTSAIPNFVEVVVPNKNGIFLNFVKGAEVAQGEYLLLLDDDIVMNDKDLVASLDEFLEKHPNVWAVGPFINEEKGSSTLAENIRYERFKRKFKIWDPDDYTNRVYSCYGKGSANHPDTLPDLPFIGCMWLTNQTLLIRKWVFLTHSCDDLPSFSKYWPIQRIWAVDFFTTYRLYLKKKDALAFLPSKSVLHLGAGKTSFDISDRIIRETICGYYYYTRYMRNQSFFEYFVRPTVGRFFYIVTTSVGIKNKIKNVIAYIKSFILLARWRNKILAKPAYASDLNLVRAEEAVKILHINHE